MTNLVWEIKRLFYALITGKASDVLAGLNIECGPKLSPDLIADLTASIPLDVVVRAQQQWLPNLGTEMAKRQDTSDQGQGCWVTTTGGWKTTLAEPSLTVDSKAPSKATLGRLAQSNQQTETKNAPGAVAAKVAATQPEAAAPKTPAANARPDGGKETPPAAERPQSKAADQTDDLLNPTEEELRGIAAHVKDAEKAARPEAKAAQPEAAAPKTPAANARPDSGKETPPAAERPQNRAADQTDDLLNPTEEELRGIPAPVRNAEKAVQPEGAGKTDTANAKRDSGGPADGAPKAGAKAPANAPPVPDTAAAEPQPRTAPLFSIISDVDAESWAEYGGWYRQDYAIFYRPTGHKDKFIYSWLVLTGPQAPKGDRNPAAAVFNLLTDKDAQGSCTKCHSVDDIRGRGRFVNFSPPSVKSKQGRFTNFIHEPHFGVLENRGCLTCHSLEKGRPYLQS